MRRHSLGPLLTDLYQLTMACGYWRAGIAQRRACFHLFFRRCPFGGSYAVAAGLEQALDFLEGVRFDADDLGYLGSLTNADGTPLFAAGFLDFLRASEPCLDVWAMPEGTVAFPHEPLLRVEGPLWQAQLVETALLNLVNFQTLVATKAARICQAATGPKGPEPVLEFGLRRAQGIDGALSASRAAFIGGCAATSNVLAGRVYGIPVRGTHAHSWVMSFPSEREAFERYAEAFPKGCVFLVDTYDTLTGVREAIEVGRALRAAGHTMVGIRLDSGDLAELSRAARALLDEAGFPEAVIVASNDLDEFRIAELHRRGAPITVWGVGTRLVTAHDQPALGGVYKLAAIEGADGRWQPRVKLSESPIKTSIPSPQQVRRFEADGIFVADAIYDVTAGVHEPKLVDPEDDGHIEPVDVDLAYEDLLAPVLRRGVRTEASPPLPDIQQRCRRQLAKLPRAVRALREPDRYFVGMEGTLARLRCRLIEEKQ